MSIHDILSNHIISQTETFDINGGDDDTREVDLSEGTVGLIIIKLATTNTANAIFKLLYSDVEFGSPTEDKGETGNFMYLGGVSPDHYPTQVKIESGVTNIPMDDEFKYIYCEIANPQGRFYKVNVEETIGGDDLFVSATDFVGPIRFSVPGEWASPPP